MRHTHLLTILYADQQSINKVPKIWGQLNEKGNGSSPDPFLARLRRALRKKGLARETKKIDLACDKFETACYKTRNGK